MKPTPKCIRMLRGHWQGYTWPQEVRIYIAEPIPYYSDSMFMGEVGEPLHEPPNHCTNWVSVQSGLDTLNNI